MSNSVWYTEVDTAIYKLLKDIIQPNMDVYFTSERDLQEDSILYPYAKVHHLGQKFAFERYDPNKQIVSIDKENNKITLEDSALPYNLNYQIDLVSDSNSLSNSVSLKWLSRIKPFFTLKVIDNGGVERRCFVSSNKPFTLEENAKDDRVVFRFIIRLTIRVEIDENTPEVSPMASGGINVNI